MTVRNLSVAATAPEAALKALIATAQCLQTAITAAGGGESGFVEVTVSKLTAKATQIAGLKFDTSIFEAQSGRVTQEQFETYIKRSNELCDELLTLSERACKLIAEEVGEIRGRAKAKGESKTTLNIDELSEQVDQAAFAALTEMSLNGAVTAFLALHVMNAASEAITAIKPA